MAIEVNGQASLKKVIPVGYIQTVVRVQKLDLPPQIGEPGIVVAHQMAAFTPGRFDSNIQDPGLEFYVDLDIGSGQAFAIAVPECVLDERKEQQRRNLLVLIVNFPDEINFPLSIEPDALQLDIVVEHLHFIAHADRGLPGFVQRKIQEL
jgi:hypothetical protein